VTQCIPGILARQLVVYRQRVAAAPVLIECETLRRDNIMRVLQEAKVKGRQRVFPPHVTLKRLAPKTRPGCMAGLIWHPVRRGQGIDRKPGILATTDIHRCILPPARWKQKGIPA
jgi:hypothetical protein